MNLEAKINRIMELKVERPENGCLLFKGGTVNGYGVIYLSGKLKLIHRVLYEKANGELVAGQRLYNICGNRNCLNVFHWKSQSNPSTTLEVGLVSEEDKRLGNWKRDPSDPNRWIPNNSI